MKPLTLLLLLSFSISAYGQTIDINYIPDSTKKAVIIEWLTPIQNNIIGAKDETKFKEFEVRQKYDIWLELIKLMLEQLRGRK